MKAPKLTKAEKAYRKNERRLNRIQVKRLRDSPIRTIPKSTNLRKVGWKLSPQHQKAIKKWEVVANDRSIFIPMAKGQKRHKQGTYYDKWELIPKTHRETRFKRVSEHELTTYDKSERQRITKFIFRSPSSAAAVVERHFSDPKHKASKNLIFRLILPDGGSPDVTYDTPQDFIEAVYRYKERFALLPQPSTFGLVAIHHKPKHKREYKKMVGELKQTMERI